jgi:translation initiation factor IF-2
MDVKTGIEEKRVKSTVIRRRAKVEPEPPVSPPPAGKEAAAEVKAPEGEPALQQAAPAEGAPTGVETGAVAVPPTEVEEVVGKVKPKKAVRRKTKDELEMEMIARAGGLKKAAELIEAAPERLERVFRPERSSKKRKVLTRKEFKKTEITTPKAIKRVIRVEGTVTVSDLARRMGIKASEVLKKLIDLGMMATVNQVLDSDTALLVAHDFGYEVENVALTEEVIFERAEKKEEAGEVEPRPPIVTVMGHVDHGKTTLLDFIRKTQVAAGEAGGITQHIGAYEVQLPKGSITFIDTPGHEAFTAMRARGAQVTDIVILVVAADDGIMPQTVEAIHHAKAAKVPIIVAINKIDKPAADVAKVERGLMEHGLVSEKLGGDTILMPVSAKTGQGVQELLEMILLQAEVLELKANPDKKALGTIIEARLDRGRGPVATVVIEEGTLRAGDIVVAGTTFGRVRAMIDALGRPVKEAPPSRPVEVLGLTGVPLAGDKLHAMKLEEDTRRVAEYREKKLRESRQQTLTPAARLEDLYAKAQEGEVPELRVIVKGDVQGSVEALREVLSKLTGEKVRISVLHSGVGAVNESDVMLAAASRAIIVGFNVRPDAKAREVAERERVQIRSYSIIYEVIDEMKKAMEGMLKPTYEEKYLGRAEVRQVFSISKVGTIAGCGVTDGKILRSASARLLRDGKIVAQGKISSLKRFKEDVREVANGLECGIGIENYNDLKVGDVIEAFTVEEIAGKL